MQDTKESVLEELKVFMCFAPQASNISIWMSKVTLKISKERRRRKNTRENQDEDVGATEISQSFLTSQSCPVPKIIVLVILQASLTVSQYGS